MRNMSLRTLLLILAGLVVVGFVVADRVGGGPSTGGTAMTVTDSDTLGAQPGTVDGSEPPHPEESHDHAGDDGSEDAPPVMVQPTRQPDVQESATQFAAAWLNAYGQSAQQWRDGLTPRMTADLVELMKNADPQSVPAGAKVGTVTATVQGSLMGADAQVVTDEAKPKTVGILRLTLLENDGRWLVTEIDWEAQK